MTMAYIRNAYRVPAKRGGRVEYSGDKAAPRLGKIIGADGARLKIRMDGQRVAGRYHPTWELRYLDAPSSAATGSSPSSTDGGKNGG